MGCRFKLFIIFLLLSAPCSAAVEDFTTYTEVDSDAKVTVTSSRVTWASANSRNVAYSVYSDKGSGHFGDFTHLITGFSSAMNNTGAQPLFGWELISNSTGDQRAVDLAGSGLELYLYTTSYHIYIEDAGGTNDFYDGAASTVYYCTFSRSGTTLQCLIYSDSGRTTLLDTLSTTCTATTFQYVNVGASYDTNESANSSGYIENLDLQEAAADPSIMQGSVLQGAVLN